jgi:hypothetical protein
MFEGYRLRLFVSRDRLVYGAIGRAVEHDDALEHFKKLNLREPRFGKVERLALVLRVGVRLVVYEPIVAREAKADDII